MQSDHWKSYVVSQSETFSSKFYKERTECRGVCAIGRNAADPSESRQGVTAAFGAARGLGVDEFRQGPGDMHQMRTNLVLKDSVGDREKAGIRNQAP